MADVTTSTAGPDRRTVLTGSVLVAGLVAVATLPSSVAHAATAPAAGTAGRAPTATTMLRGLEAVRAEALASVGKPLTGSPWRGFGGSSTTGPWNAVFTSWLLRSNGITATTRPVTQLQQLAAAGRVSSVPRAGALIFYHHGSTATTFHVGLVYTVRGASVETIEADVPGELAPGHTFVRRFGVPWSNQLVFGYPWYAGEA